MKRQITSSHTLVEVLVAGVCSATVALVLVGVLVSMLGTYSVGTTDFVEYWASGHQLIRHADPYSADAIGVLERGTGYDAATPPLIMWNPPYALPLTLPLGLFDAKSAHIIWIVLLACSLLLSIRLVWIMNGRDKAWITLLGYSFAPALVCLLAGQVSLFILLGWVLFLYLNRARPFLAGASLWFCLLKPQLFVPLAFVALAWIIVTRSYAVLAGVLCALAVASSMAYLFDPLVLQHYLHMVRSAHLDLSIPCTSLALRRFVSPGSAWIQYVPAALGVVWSLSYFRRHSKDWNWLEHGSLLIMVSVLAAPYMWLLDQVVLIPALLRAAFRTNEPRLLLGLALINSLVCICAIWSRSVLHSLYLVLMVPAWLAWYLLAAHSGIPYASDRATDLSVGPAVSE